MLDKVGSLNGENYSDDFRPQIEAMIATHISECLSALKGNLDPLSIKLSTTASGFHCALYNYFQSYAPQTVQARQQAIVSFPFLSERILLNSYKDVRGAIDSRAALAPVCWRSPKTDPLEVRLKTWTVLCI